MANRYELHSLEPGQKAYRKVEIIWTGDDWGEALNELNSEVSKRLSDRAELLLIERENTGILFSRVIVHIDGRPFCKVPSEAGPDKYGF